MSLEFWLLMALSVYWFDGYDLDDPQQFIEWWNSAEERWEDKK